MCILLRLSKLDLFVNPRCPWWQLEWKACLCCRQWKRHHSQGIAGQQISGRGCCGSQFWAFFHPHFPVFSSQASTLSRAGGTAADLTGVFWLKEKLWIDDKTIQKHLHFKSCLNEWYPWVTWLLWLTPKSIEFSTRGEYWHWHQGLSGLVHRDLHLHVLDQAHLCEAGPSYPYETYWSFFGDGAWTKEFLLEVEGVTHIYLLDTKPKRSNHLQVFGHFTRTVGRC